MIRHTGPKEDNKNKIDWLIQPKGETGFGTNSLHCMTHQDSNYIAGQDHVKVITENQSWLRWVQERIIWAVYAFISKGISSNQPVEDRLYRIDPCYKH